MYAKENSLKVGNTPRVLVSQSNHHGGYRADCFTITSNRVEWS